MVLDGGLELLDEFPDVSDPVADLADEPLGRAVFFVGVLFEFWIDVGESRVDDLFFHCRVHVQFLTDLVGGRIVWACFVLAEELFHLAMVLLQQFDDIHGWSLSCAWPRVPPPGLGQPFGG